MSITLASQIPPQTYNNFAHDFNGIGEMTKTNDWKLLLDWLGILCPFDWRRGRGCDYFCTQILLFISITLYNFVEGFNLTFLLDPLDTFS